MKKEAIQNERDRIGSTKRTARKRAMISLPQIVVDDRSPRVAAAVTAATEERDSESDETTSISSASIFAMPSSVNATATPTAPPQTAISDETSARLLTKLEDIERRLEATLNAPSTETRSCRQFAVQYVLSGRLSAGYSASSSRPRFQIVWQANIRLGYSSLRHPINIEFNTLRLFLIFKREINTYSQKLDNS